MTTISESFEVAWQCHQSGRLAQAEQICREIVTAEPGFANAWHLLGFMAFDAGQDDVAAECLGRQRRLVSSRPV